MNFVEFIEATCRVADRLAIPNPRIDHVDPDEPPDAAVVIEWGERPLAEKIEALLLTLAMNCLGKKAFDEALATTEAFHELPNIFANDIEVTGGTKKLEKGIKDYQELANKK
jgi:hypothetical protein